MLKICLIFYTHVYVPHVGCVIQPVTPHYVSPASSNFHEQIFITIRIIQ